MTALQENGKPGLFRIIQIQRDVWAEMEGDKLKLRSWHTSSPENLQRLVDAYMRDDGKWPIAKERELRSQMKKKKKPNDRD